MLFWACTRACAQLSLSHGGVLRNAAPHVCHLVLFWHLASPLAHFVGGTWSHLRGVVLAVMCLWKPDFAQAVCDFWPCFGCLTRCLRLCPVVNKNQLSSFTKPPVSDVSLQDLDPSTRNQAAAVMDDSTIVIREGNILVSNKIAQSSWLSCSFLSRFRDLSSSTDFGLASNDAANAAEPIYEHADEEVGSSE